MFVFPSAKQVLLYCVNVLRIISQRCSGDAIKSALTKDVGAKVGYDLDKQLTFLCKLHLQNIS